MSLAVSASSEAASVPVSSPTASATSASSPSASPSVLDSPATPLPPLIVRVGLPSDAAALTVFARDIFVSCFGPHNTPEDMAGYTQGAFSEAIQREELLNPDLSIFIAERAGEIVGYALMRVVEVPECVDDKAAIKLQRLYGFGVGAPLMRRCLAHALWLGRRHVWLGAWEKNYRAFTFYEKYNFVDCGAHHFQLGSKLKADRVMQIRLEPIVANASSESSAASPSPPPALSPMVDFTPLPTSASLRDRVLHAVKHIPYYAEEHEHGCSLTQIAFGMGVDTETIEPVLRELVDAGLVQRTVDEQHFKTTAN